MTPLPKRRWSTRRQGKRRATLKVTTSSSVVCSNCGQLKPNHVACPKCGFYRGRQVLKIKTRNKEESSYAKASEDKKVENKN